MFAAVSDPNGLLSLNRLGFMVHSQVTDSTRFWTSLPGQPPPATDSFFLLAANRAGESQSYPGDVLDASGEVGVVLELRDHAAKMGGGRLIPLHPEFLRSNFPSGAPSSTDHRPLVTVAPNRGYSQARRRRSGIKTLPTCFRREERKSLGPCHRIEKHWHCGGRHCSW